MESSSIRPLRLTWIEPTTSKELNHPTGMVGKHMYGIGKRMQAAARIQVGHSTGLLAASIQVSQSPGKSGQTMTVGSSVSYAYYVHEGTRPHFIRGRNGGALRFTKGTRVVYSRAVVHPGTKPNKFLSSQLYMVRS